MLKLLINLSEYFNDMQISKKKNQCVKQEEITWS